MSQRSRNLVSATALVLLWLVVSSCSDSTAPAKPTKLVLVTAPSAIAGAMVPLDIQPVVQTVDANGHAVSASTTVTASVISGPGEVVAGGTAQTNATGLATFSGLTLARTPLGSGSVALQLAAPGLDPVTATFELRCGVLTLSIPQTLNRSLSTGNCTLNPSFYYEFFALTTTRALTPVQLTLAAKFPGSLSFAGPNDPHSLVGFAQPYTSVSLSFKVLLPPGSSSIVVGSAQNSPLGNYTLTTAAATEDLSCDASETAITAPITSTQQLGPGDCVDGSYVEDLALFALPTNGSVSVTMTSSDFDPYIEVLDGQTQASLNSATGKGSASLSFTNTGARNTYLLMLSSSVAGASGHYSFSMSATYPVGASATPTLALPFVGLRIPPPSRVSRAKR